MRKWSRRAACLGLALFAVTANGARAEDYPARPVRIIIGFGPGSVADIAARVLASKISQTLGQQFVVENRTGAGSNIAAEYVARAPKDGYTLFMATVANTINPALNKLSFDFGKDLAPVILVANVPQMMVVHRSLGISSVQELIALAKSKPEEIQYASSGVGTLSHLSAELLNSAAGIKLMQVPYPGTTCLPAACR
jgi:tripartite-type tricarboxylate transporter receptor subunit TctC